MTNTLLRLTHDFSTNVVATESIPAIIWVSVVLVSPSTWGREKLHNTCWKRVAWVTGRKCNPTTKVQYPHPTPSFRNTNFAKVLSHAYPTQGIADAKANIAWRFENVLMWIVRKCSSAKIETTKTSKQSWPRHWSLNRNPCTFIPGILLHIISRSCLPEAKGIEAWISSSPSNWKPPRFVSVAVEHSSALKLMVTFQPSSRYRVWNDFPAISLPLFCHQVAHMHLQIPLSQRDWDWNHWSSPNFRPYKCWSAPQREDEAIEITIQNRGWLGCTTCQAFSLTKPENP